MEYIIIGSLVIIFVIILKYIFKYNRKQLENIVKNEKLDKIVKKYPENIEMTKEYLKMLNNEDVEIEENNQSDSSLYIAMINKILIGNTRNSYTRIQTIAHECLHTVQDRRLLTFNFIFSNLYILFFIIISILGIFRILPYKMMFLVILVILSLIYLVVRLYLENDAMIKAPFLVEKYMKNKKISSEEEIEETLNGLNKINEVGIKSTNYYTLGMILLQILVFTIIAILL